MEKYQTIQTLEDLPTREQELEACMKRHPDIINEVIVKDDLLRLGLSFSKTALKLAQQSQVKGYMLFTYDMDTFDEQAGEAPLNVPEEIRVKNGIYDLKPTVVRTRIRSRSPYLVDTIDGKLVLLSNGREIAEVDFPVRPSYYSNTFDGGAMYYEVIPLVHWGQMAFLTAFKFCQFWGQKEECKYCDINENAKQLREAGRPAMGASVKDLEQSKQVMKAIFKDKNENVTQPRTTCLLISGGTILGKLQGFTEPDFYLQYAQAFRDIAGSRYPILLVVTPSPKEVLKRYSALGNVSIWQNIEVCDPKLFSIMCPGKQRFVGFDTVIKYNVEAVDLFGEGNVTPDVVTGVEMAQPWGFKDADSAVKSTGKWYDYLMSHGVIPMNLHWCIEKRSALGGHPPVPLEYAVRIDQTWVETWQKYRLPIPTGMGQIGRGLATHCNAGFMDMAATAK